jgi:hypothetical protein
VKEKDPCLLAATDLIQLPLALNSYGSCSNYFTLSWILLTYFLYFTVRGKPMVASYLSVWRNSVHLNQERDFHEISWDFRRPNTCTLFKICIINIADHSGRAKAWTIFACSNTGIVGSNPTRRMYVCVRLLCVCVVLCVWPRSRRAVDR